MDIVTTDPFVISFFERSDTCRLIYYLNIMKADTSVMIFILEQWDIAETCALIYSLNILKADICDILFFILVVECSADFRLFVHAHFF